MADKGENKVEKVDGKSYVTQEFRDIDNFSKVYEVDQDVSDLPAERLATLTEKGLVEKFEKPKEEPKK